MGSQAIDLSAGLIRKQQIDLSAGLVPKSNLGNLQTLDPNQEGMQAKPSGFYADLKGLVTGAPEGIARMIPGPQQYYQYQDARADIESIKQTGKTRAQLADQARKQAGYGLGYRALAPVGEQLGANVQGMEQSAREGDQLGVMGHATAAATPYVAGAIGGEIMHSPQGQAVVNRVGNAASVPADAAIGKWEAYKARPQMATMPQDIGRMPPKVVLGAEDIFRASAPTGGNQGFRANVYAAAPDLADIARKIDLSEAKGGMIRPDMRVHATVDAIGEHLAQMDKTERVPQIERNADAPVSMNVGPDSTKALEYLSKNGSSDAVRSVAAKALEEKTLTLAEADKLRMAGNAALTDFESMTAAERAQKAATSQRLFALKSLDKDVGAGMDGVLTNAGEPGLRGFERRYAALSEIRNQLSTRFNAVELKQPGMVKGAIQPIAKVLTGGTSGVASASQAAVADVGIGKMLQRGLKTLGDSGITAKR